MSAISGAPWGFSYAGSVSIGPFQQYVYVADRSNSRIQVFKPSGEFVEMFGQEVDKITKADICTALSKDECQAGQPAVGGPPGQIAEPTSLAIDRGTGDVYVLDWVEHRVEKYTPQGEFLLMIGGGVNKTEDETAGASEEQKNTCTEEEISVRGVVCREGTQSKPGTKSHGEFEFPSDHGNLLSVGPEHMLYVGDQGRVQEFEENGKYTHEIALPAVAEAVAVDRLADLYVMEPAATVRKFSNNGSEVKEGQWPYVGHFREEGGEFLGFRGLAVDPDGRVATTGFESFRSKEQSFHRSFGLLLAGATGELITEFTGFDLAFGLAFNELEVAGTGGFDMYLMNQEPREVLVYRPVPVGELKIETTTCSSGPDVGTDSTFNCTLRGQANPHDVPDTSIWFQWGITPALGRSTPAQDICTASCGNSPIGVSAMLEGLYPAEPVVYGQLAGDDQNNQPPEAPLTSAETSFATPTVPPKVVGPPTPLFVGSTSAVVFDEVNPENAGTEYFLEYGECPESDASCETVPYSNRSTALKSHIYGTVGAALQATDLRARARYHYRVVAVNRKGEKALYVNAKDEADSEEGLLVTEPAPSVQAETGLAENVSVTSAILAGNVDPGGEAATYTFELGIYNGETTRFGAVFTGVVPVSRTAVPERFVIDGLQPGTTYAYRISVANGYSRSTGSAIVFKTLGLTAVFPITVPREMLPLPPIKFPGANATACRRGYVRNHAGKCVRKKSKNKKKNAKRNH